MDGILLAASDWDSSEKIFKESQTTPVCYMWKFDITQLNLIWLCVRLYLMLVHIGAQKYTWAYGLIGCDV